MGALLILCSVSALWVPSSFAAEGTCSLAAAEAAAPSGMVIGDISDAHFGKIKTNRGIALVTPNENKLGEPEYCLVTGKIVTNPKTHKTANFAVGLPIKSAWNGKFLFEGCGYNCGMIWGPPAAAELKKGYPVWVTDDGHEAKPSPSKRLADPTDASWAVTSPGHSATDAVTDFDYRAVHTLTMLGKAFTRKFYGSNHIRYSYFVGCSDGGREGMKEVSKYPADYNGVVAGAPYFDMTNEMLATQVALQAQLRSSGAALSRPLFDLLSKITEEKCDVTDGVKDGLIQNPARCDFEPAKDLPICGIRQEDGLCFTREQAQSVSIIFSATTDPDGAVMFPGWSISNPNADLAEWIGFPAPAVDLRGPNPWSPANQPLGWYWSNWTIKNMVFDGSPSYNALTTLGITFRTDQRDGAEFTHAVIPQRTVRILEEKNAPGSGATPKDAAAFFELGGKLIMFHGFSDGLITPFRTIQYYKALAALHGGYEKLRESAELFMVPGMGHCAGGPGPNSFGQYGELGFLPADAEHDIVTALSDWVEEGSRPTSLIATKYQGEKPIGSAIPTGRPVPVRTMPLCPFPQEARYKGSGNVNDAQNWTCAAGDTRLLNVGSAGKRVGVGAPLRPQGS